MRKSRTRIPCLRPQTPPLIPLCPRSPRFPAPYHTEPSCKGTNVTLSMDGKPLRNAKVDQPPSASDNQAVLRVSFLEQVCGVAGRVGKH